MTPHKAAQRQVDKVLAMLANQGEVGQIVLTNYRNPAEWGLSEGAAEFKNYTNSLLLTALHQRGYDAVERWIDFKPYTAWLFKTRQGDSENARAQYAAQHGTCVKFAFSLSRPSVNKSEQAIGWCVIKEGGE